jgi:beta-phosphoglucomutase-like phosphatase (HAD superfamily)
MNDTEQLLQAINELLGALGDKPIQITVPAGESELTLLRTVTKEYLERLLAKVPAYRALPKDAPIPDMFLQALRDHEAELEGKSE